MITAKDLMFDDHPLLRTVVDEVPIPLTAEDKDLMKKMAEYLKNSQDKKLAKAYGLKEGVGLAAPQIGLNKRIISVRAEDETGELHDYVLANPKVISHSEELTYLPNGEGCLSVADEYLGIVPRYRRMKVKGYDGNGDLVQVKVKDYIAIIFQHEMDHLNGKLFYDHIDQENPLMPIPGAKPIDFD